MSHAEKMAVELLPSSRVTHNDFKQFTKMLYVYELLQHVSTYKAAELIDWKMALNAAVVFTQP